MPHPRSKYNKPYNPEDRNKQFFSGNRELAIIRDGEKCVKCGMTRKEHKDIFKRDITVDHIDNYGTKRPKEERHNDLNNLQTLCLRCHTAKDHRFKKLSDNQVANIRHMRGEISNGKIALLYGVSREYVGQLMSNKWRKNDE